MRRSRLAVAVLACVGIPALILLARQTRSARVLEKREQIVVNARTGSWYHDYVVRVMSSDGAATSTQRDTLSIAVGRNQYDAARFGSHVSIGMFAFAKRTAWLRDTSSARATLMAAIDARRTVTRHPEPVSPLDAQTAGLARVVRSHRVQLSSPGKNLVGWIQLVEVEFWAQRVRSLVRTIDVIDAGSMPNLQAGDIVQMHYDPRDPRTLRLDNGRRTFAAEAEP